MTTKAESPALFDRIAATYDTVNRILSFGIDSLWRKRVVQRLPQGDVLDLACGTGELALAIARRDGVRVTGLDLSEGMLEVARRRTEGQSITLIHGDAQQLPLPDSSFDATTIAFGIRNVPDVPAALAEMHRVLRPGGRTFILEFSLPANRVVRALHCFYLRHALPLVGGWVSGDRAAYRYLNTTIEAFPYGEDFLGLVREAGFSDCTATPLTMGIATLYEGRR
jgi:demethylmenaquinone methyltransferase/2-methoxy-6-polyprenyl-1,4-benzoquinol methylase